MTNQIPKGLTFVKKFVGFGKLVFDTDAGGDVNSLLGPANGSIVPYGTAAIFVVELADQRALLGHTTKFNEAQNTAYSRDDGAFLAFSMNPDKVFRPTSAHPHDVYKSNSNFGWGGGHCLSIARDLVYANPHFSYDDGFTAVSNNTPYRRLRVWLAVPAGADERPPPPALPPKTYTLQDIMALFPDVDMSVNVGLVGVPNSAKSRLINALASFVNGKSLTLADDSGGSVSSGHCTMALRKYNLLGDLPGGVAPGRRHGCEIVLFDTVGYTNAMETMCVLRGSVGQNKKYDASQPHPDANPSLTVDDQVHSIIFPFSADHAVAQKKEWGKVTEIRDMLRQGLRVNCTCEVAEVAVVPVLTKCDKLQEATGLSDLLTPTSSFTDVLPSMRSLGWDAHRVEFLGWMTEPHIPWHDLSDPRVGAVSRILHDAVFQAIRKLREWRKFSASPTVARSLGIPASDSSTRAPKTGNMTVAQLEAAFHNSGLDPYVPALAESEIDGAVFCAMTEEELEEVFGSLTFGARKKMQALQLG